MMLMVVVVCGLLSLAVVFGLIRPALQATRLSADGEELRSEAGPPRIEVAGRRGATQSRNQGRV